MAATYLPTNIPSAMFFVFIVIHLCQKPHCKLPIETQPYLTGHTCHIPATQPEAEVRGAPAQVPGARGDGGAGRGAGHASRTAGHR